MASSREGKRRVELNGQIIELDSDYFRSQLEYYGKKDPERLKTNHQWLYNESIEEKKKDGTSN